MARPPPSTETLEAILRAVPASGTALSLQAIQAQLGGDLPRRTLQRWVEQLQHSGRLRKLGNGRASRYQATDSTSSERHDAAAGTDGVREAAGIDLSAESEEVLDRVQRPPSQRMPTGYDRAFLDDYRPNHTFYLPSELRAELRAAGQAAAGIDQPAGTYARQILDRLLIDLSWNSSRLEGNTYSLLETERLVAAGEAVAGKDAFEAQMILNHKAAIEFLVDSASDIGFNRYTVLNLHALLSDNLLSDPTASGRLRRIAVGIGHSVFHPLEGPQRIEECFRQLLDTASAIADPLEQAFFAMVHIPYLQPFEDVNKRVSRLAANIPLIKGNLCPLSFVDVSQVLYTSATLGIYELRQVALLRDVFAWAYRRSCARYSAVRQSLGEPDPFRLRYRDLLMQVVAEIVRRPMDKRQAIAFIHQASEARLPAADRARFTELAETEVLSLHEGNMARYRVRPSEYGAWRAVWDH